MRKKAIIIPYFEIKKALELFENKNTVLVGGCFDLIHYGHLQFLKKAKESGDFLIVCLESDEFIKKTKRNEPIHSQEERAEILASMNFIDLVVNLPYLKTSEQYFEMVSLIKPKIIAVTEGDTQLLNKKKQAEKIGSKVVVVTPLLKKYSTRKIVSNFD